MVDLGNVLRPSGNRDIETITGEILELKQTAGDAILTIGARLIEAKAVLAHGEWTNWLAEKVDFSERTAQKYMRLSREWSNPQTLAVLGSSKAVTLLALSSAEREEFVEETHVVNGKEKTAEEMSARELEQAIRERKEAQEAAARAEADKRAAEQARDKISDEMKIANARIESLSETEAHLDEVIAGLRKELKELQDRPIETTYSDVPNEAALAAARKEGAEEAAKTARREAEEKLKARIEKAEKAKTDAEAQAKAARAEREIAQAKTEALEKQLKLVGSPAATEFKVHFDAAQKEILQMEGCLDRIEDRDLRDKLTTAMLAAGKKLSEDAAKRLGTKEAAV